MLLKFDMLVVETILDAIVEAFC